MNGESNSRETVGLDRLSTLFPEKGCWYEVILGMWRIGGGSSGGAVGHIPNYSVAGIRRIEENILELYLYEHSNSFDSIEMNPEVILFIPTGKDRIDRFIECALRGYGTDEIETEPALGRGERAFPEAAPSPKGPGETLTALVKSIESEMKVDEYGQIGRKLVRLDVKETRPDLSKGGTGIAGYGSAPAFSRSEGLIMESLVPATRYLSLGEKEIADQMESSLERAVALGGKLTGERVKMIRTMVYSSSSSE